MVQYLGFHVETITKSCAQVRIFFKTKYALDANQICNLNKT